MFTIFTLIFFVGVFALLVLLLGLFLRGQVKRFFVGFAVFLLALCAFTIFSHDIFGPSKDDRKRFSGIFKIDTTKLNYPKDTLKKYYDLTLEVKTDMSFSINKPNPFFKSLYGEWDYETVPDMEFLQYKFDGDINESAVILMDTASWTFFSRDTSSQTIIFRRTIR